MKVIAWLTARGVSATGSESDTRVCACWGVEQSGSAITKYGLEITLDLTRTEDELREDIRVAVAKDVNTRLGVAITSADVRLL